MGSDESVVVLTAVIALATVVYAVLTAFLLVEYRAARLEAAVVAWAAPWEVVHMQLAVIAWNYGPALARDFSITIDVLDGDGAKVDSLTLDEVYLAPGARRRFLPLRDRVELEAAADLGVSIRMRWQWFDSRRDYPWRPWRRKRHGANVESTVASIRDAYRGSGALLEKDVEYRLSKIEEHLREGLQVLKRDSQE